MALGKPVICYIREEDLGFIPSQMKEQLPLIQATPQTIYQVLKSWLTERKSEIIERGRQSRRYVEQWHNPLQIARQMREHYQAII